MANCNSADSILEAAALIKANGQKIDKFTNGSASETVQLGTGDPTPTLKKLVQDVYDSDSYVHKTGTETISGVKTFTTPIVSDVQGHAIWAAGGIDDSVGLYYFDSENGSDSNDGLTRSTAFKTFAPFYEIMNKGKHPVYNIRLIGSGTYVWSWYVCNQGDVHFFADTSGQTPTLFLTSARSQGPHFYSIHVVMSGLIIDSDAYSYDGHANIYGIYFENCTTNLANCDFKIPVDVAGGDVVARNTSFSVKAGQYVPYGNGHRPALTLGKCNAALNSPTFKNSDGESRCLYAYQGCALGVYGTITFTQHSTPNTEPFIMAAGSHISLQASSNFSSIYQSGEHFAHFYGSTAVLFSDAYSDFTSYRGVSTGSMVTNGSVNISGPYKPFYVDGDVYSINSNIVVPGFISNSTKTMYVTIPVEKSLRDITEISVNALAASTRQSDGTYIPASGYINYITSSEPSFTITATKASNHLVTLNIATESEIPNATNNASFMMYISALSFSLSTE